MYRESGALAGNGLAQRGNCGRTATKSTARTSTSIDECYVCTMIRFSYAVSIMRLEDARAGVGVKYHYIRPLASNGSPVL